MQENMHIAVTRPITESHECHLELASDVGWLHSLKLRCSSWGALQARAAPRSGGSRLDD